MGAAVRGETPTRSLQQQMDALQRANLVRTRRADTKKAIGWRFVSAHELLAAPPEFMESMKVFDLLLAMPKVGRVKANKLLRVCGVSPSKTLGGLTDRQDRKSVV